jgi:ribosomal-protein-serine acetyltransferase
MTPVLAPAMLRTRFAELWLIPIQEVDADELFALTAANREYLRQWLPWVDETRELADSKAYVRDALELQRLGLRLDYTLRLHGRMVGTVAFHTLNRAHRNAVIGYWLAREATGHGYMTESVRCLLELAFGELGLNRVEIRVAVDNKASQRIADRLGFQSEGVLRQAEWIYDHFVDLRVAAVLRAEWTAAQGIAPTG